MEHVSDKKNSFKNYVKESFPKGSLYQTINSVIGYLYVDDCEGESLTFKTFKIPENSIVLLVGHNFSDNQFFNTKTYLHSQFLFKDEIPGSLNLFLLFIL